MQYSKFTISANLIKAKEKFDNYLFRVSVPYLETLSDYEISEYGIYQSGNKDVDKSVYSEMTTVYIPTKDILRYFKNGATIRLPKATDIKEIYLTIQEYLEAWRLTLENGINLAEAPSIDLLDLDNLATEIFSRAKYYFNNTEAESLIVNFLAQNQRTTSQNFFDSSINKLINTNQDTLQGNDGLVTINSIDDKEHQERESLTDFFKNKMYSTKFHR